MLTDPKQRATSVKKPGHYRNQCRLLKKRWEQTENHQTNPGNINSYANKSNANSNANNINNNNENSNRAERKPKTVYPPCETCGKTSHSTGKCYYGANAGNRPPPRHRRPEKQNQFQEKASQNDSYEIAQAATQNLNWQCEVFTPELRLTDRRWPALKLPPIPVVVWQQPRETHLTNIQNLLSNETHKDTHIPEFKQKINVEAQTSRKKQTSSQVSGSDTEPLLENQTRSTPVQCPNDCKTQQSKIQRNETDLIT